jgi:hypothetical protein
MEKDIIASIKAAEQAKRKALRELHKVLGYPSAKALAEALLEAADVTVTAGTKTQASPVKVSAEPAATGKRPRISEETKKAIGDALKAGETGNRLTEQFGVSYGVVHEIKTKLGLVKKKKTSKKKA